MVTAAEKNRGWPGKAMELTSSARAEEPHRVPAALKNFGSGVAATWRRVVGARSGLAAVITRNAILNMRGGLLALHKVRAFDKQSKSYWG